MIRRKEAIALMERALELKSELKVVEQLLKQEYAREGDPKPFSKRVPVEHIWLQEAKNPLMPPLYKVKQK